MHYVIGDEAKSRMLSANEIRSLAPEFLDKLIAVLGLRGERAMDLISRKGRLITARQVKSLLVWLNSG
jgi:hypothetical protein